MDPVLVTAGIGVGLTLTVLVRRWAWSYTRRTRRALRKTRVTRIADLVDGKLQCIVGRVELEGDPLTGLMSRRRCVAYETIVQEYGPDGLAPTHVDVERRMVPFFVVDASGRARIDAPEAALSNHPVARGDRYEERVIEPGMTVRLVGSATIDPALDPSRERGFRDGGFTATITGSARFPLLVDVEHSK